MIDDIKEGCKHMCLVGIDKAEFHDSSRTPVHYGSEIGDWNQKFAIEAFEDLSKVRRDLISVRVISAEKPVSDLRVAEGVQPKLEA